MEDQEGRVETTVKFTWTIKNFSKLNCRNLYSETFFTGCHPWRIVIYPKGNDADGLSIYLAVGDTANFPVGWSRSANISLSLINQFNGKMTRTKGFQHQFNAKEVDRGYKSFISSVEFRNPSKGFLVNDTCIIVAEVSVENLGHEDTDDNPSPKEMSSASYDELMDFKGLGKIEKDYVPLLEEACSKHPTLIESQRKRNRSRRFTEWAFTALGRVLHFLKMKKVKDMNDDACKELQNLWDELETVRFDDLTWLEPHVQSALGMKGYMERAAQVKKLTENVADLEREIKSLKLKMVAAEADLEKARRELAKAEEGFVKRDLDLEIARRELAKAEEGFVKRDLDDELGCGIP